jgi:hypothetical protein
MECTLSLYFSKNISHIILDYACFKTFEEFMKNIFINLQKKNSTSEIFFEKYISNIYDNFVGCDMESFNIIAFLPKAKKICEYKTIDTLQDYNNSLQNTYILKYNIISIYVYQSHVIVYDYIFWDEKSNILKIKDCLNVDIIDILNSNVQIFPIHNFNLSKIEDLDKDILNNLDFLISYFKNFYPKDGYLKFNSYIEQKYKHS